MPTYTRVTSHYKPQPAAQLNVDPRYGRILVALLLLAGTAWLIWQATGWMQPTPEIAAQVAESPPAQPSQDTSIVQPPSEVRPIPAYAGTDTEMQLYEYAMLYGPYAFTVYGESMTIGLGSTPFVVPLPAGWADWNRAARLDWILSVYVEQFGEVVQ